MKQVLLALLFFSFQSFSQKDLKNAPPSFKLGGSKAVFIDFTNTQYNITYDTKTRSTKAYSTIDFYMGEAGYPLIDLVPQILESSIDEQIVKFNLITPPGANSGLLASDKIFKKGYHQLKIHHRFDRLVKYSSGSVSSAFWMSDLSRRGFLERYLPTSFEHDQLNLKINIQILNSAKKHVVMTNGFRESPSESSWKLSYPNFYTSSLIYLHIFPAGSKNMKSEYVQSIDGRQIPFTVYTNKSIFFPQDLRVTMQKSKQYFKELEQLYGPWPHDFFIAYIAGSGGMEYAGATMTSMGALRHEMNHSYFARNIIPARGNSGWIDEAIASWADDQYPTILKTIPTGVASHSVYRRTTDRNAYGPGSKFLAFLDGKFKSKGGLKPFLRYYFEKRQKSTVLTQNFQEDMEEFFNIDLTQVFSNYVYSKTFIPESHQKFFDAEANKYHPHHTEKDLINNL